MGVILQIRSPGMQNLKHSRLTAEMLWICRQSLDAVRRGLHENGKKIPLVRPNQVSQFMWNGEYQMKVTAWQKITQATLDPFFAV